MLWLDGDLHANPGPPRPLSASQVRERRGLGKRGTRAAAGNSGFCGSWAVFISKADWGASCEATSTGTASAEAAEGQYWYHTCPVVLVGEVISFL